MGPFAEALAEELALEFDAADWLPLELGMADAVRNPPGPFDELPAAVDAPDEVAPGDGLLGDAFIVGVGAGLSSRVPFAMVSLPVAS